MRTSPAPALLPRVTPAALFRLTFGDKVPWVVAFAHFPFYCTGCESKQASGDGGLPIQQYFIDPLASAGASAPRASSRASTATRG